MKNQNISKETIDMAAHIKIEKKLPWSEVANEIYDLGYRYLNNDKKIHNWDLCIAVINDPDYTHLRKGTTFSHPKRMLIIEALKAENICDEKIVAIMRRLPLSITNP